MMFNGSSASVDTDLSVKYKGAASIAKEKRKRCLWRVNTRAEIDDLIRITCSHRFFVCNVHYALAAIQWV